MQSEYKILLVDMNSFYASVHQALDPSLQGKKVIVCGDPEKRHGIVLAASYPAKKMGVKTGMPNWEAKILCPDGIFIRPQYQHYFNFSNQIVNIMRDFSPLVEPFSIDEAFIDLSGTEHLFGDSVAVAKEIKRRIKDEVGVLCSVGIGPNKLVAKMAADLQKPDGLTVINPEDVPKRLWPLPVKELFGVGSRTQKKLNMMAVNTIGDLAKFPVDVLKKKFGVVGQILHMSANGIDYSPVDPHSLDTVKSIGNQLTLSRDYAGADIRVAVLDICEKVSYRLRQGGYVGKTVSLTLRDTELHGYHWSISFRERTDITEEIYRMAIKLLETHWLPNKRVRLVGIGISNVERKQYEQLDIFTYKEKYRKLNHAVDDIRQRFGNLSIQRGISMTEAGILHEKFS
jgi:DNA polymerase-4